MTRLSSQNDLRNMLKQVLLSVKTDAGYSATIDNVVEPYDAKDKTKRGDGLYAVLSPLDISSRELRADAGIYVQGWAVDIPLKSETGVSARASDLLDDVLSALGGVNRLYKPSVTQAGVMTPRDGASLWVVSVEFSLELIRQVRRV